MNDLLKKVFVEPIDGFIEKVSQFLPSLMTGIVLVITGLIVAWLLKLVIVQFTRLVKVDALSERVGAAKALHGVGIREPASKLIGRLIYWVVFIPFVVMGLDAMKVPAIEKLLAEFFLYLPNVIMAAVVIVIGYLTGNFLGRTALIASVNAGLAISSLLGKFVKYTVFFIALSMALELLGIGKDTVLVAFAIVMGGVVLALAIAFGHGGRAAAERYIEKRLKEKEEEKDEIEHI
jgi:small-conductance mechanosensitive channel